MESGFEAYGTIAAACSAYTESMDGGERSSINGDARTSCLERVDEEEHYRASTNTPAHSGWTFKFNFIIIFYLLVQKSLRHGYGHGYDRTNSANPTTHTAFHDPDPRRYDNHRKSERQTICSCTHPRATAYLGSTA